MNLSLLQKIDSMFMHVVVCLINRQYVFLSSVSTSFASTMIRFLILLFYIIFIINKQNDFSSTCFAVKIYMGNALYTIKSEYRLENF